MWPGSCRTKRHVLFQQIFLDFAGTVDKTLKNQQKQWLLLELSSNLFFLNLLITTIKKVNCALRRYKGICGQPVRDHQRRLSVQITILWWSRISTSTLGRAERGGVVCSAKCSIWRDEMNKPIYSYGRSWAYLKASWSHTSQCGHSDVFVEQSADTRFEWQQQEISRDSKVARWHRVYAHFTSS